MDKKTAEYDLISEKIDNLQNLDKKILFLLFTSFYKLDELQILSNFSFIKNNKKVLTSISNLVDNKFISIDENKNKKSLYYISNIDSIHYLKKNIVKKAYIENTNRLIKLHTEESISEFTSIFNTILVNKDKITNDSLSKISDSIKNLYTYKFQIITQNLNLELLLQLLYKFTNNSDYKKILRIELLKYYLESVEDIDSVYDFYSLFRKLENTVIKKESKFSFIQVQYILLKYKTFHPKKNNFNYRKFFNKNIIFLKRNLSKDNFYKTHIELYDFLMDSVESTHLSLTSFTKYFFNDFKNEDDIDTSIYYYNFKAFDYEIRSIKNTNKIKKFLEESLQYFKDRNKYDYFYFIFFRSYVRISFVHEIDIKKDMLLALSNAVSVNNYKYILAMLKNISDYYFFSGEYNKALKYMIKFIETSKKININIPYLNYFNLSTLKFMLMEPSSEIINGFSEIENNKKIKERAELYLNYFNNKILIYYFTGSYEQSKKSFYEYYNACDELRIKNIFYGITSVLDIVPEIFTKDEFLHDIEQLRFNKKLNKIEYNKLIRNIDSIYNNRLVGYIRPEKYNQIISNSFSNTTPFMIVEYIINEKRLPPPKKIFDNIGSNFKTSANIENYTSYLITKFFFSKDSELIKEIYANLKNFYINGYLLKAVYQLLPIIDFLIIVKFEKDEIIMKFNQLLIEIFDDIEKKMDRKSISNFHETYIYKRFSKIQKKIVKLFSSKKTIDSKYEIIDLIGKGSHGEVFSAFSIDNKDKILAIKLIDISIKKETKSGSENETEKVMLDMVKSEFKLLKSLKHENIVNVFDIGYDNKIKKLYYTMEYLKGEPINEFFDKKFNEDIFLEATYQSLQGLSHLHDNGIIHYDIKPENLFICKTGTNKFTLKIFDFGLSELKHANRGSNKVKGTLDYMAPEVLLSPETVSFNADLYSLGVSLLSSITHISGNFIFSSESIDSENLLYSENYISKFRSNNIRKLNQIDNPRILNYLSILIEEDPSLRTKTAKNAIEKMNFIFNKKFNLSSIHKENSFLNNNTFIVREKEYKDLIKEYTLYFSPKRTPKNENVLFITGQKGSGKTKLLKHFNTVLNIRLKKVVYNNFIAFKNSELDKAFDKFEEMLERHLNIKKLVESVDDSIVVIFDDFNKYNSYTKELILKILVEYRNNESIFFLISVDRRNKSLESIFSQFDKNYYKTIKEIRLKSLKKKDAIEIIEKLIGKTLNFPRNFAENLILFSKGNFKKIMILLDQLSKNKIINRTSEIALFRNEIEYNKILNNDIIEKAILEISNLSKTETYILNLIFIN